MAYPHLAHLIDRLVRRVRLAHSADGAVRAGLASAGLLCAATALHKFHPLAPALWWALAAALPTLAAAWILAAWLHPVSRLAVAGIADANLGLHDRLSSAMEFLDAPEPTPFMLAHLADADARARALNPAEAFPFPRPRGLRSLTAAGVIAAFLTLVPSFAGPAPASAQAAHDTLPPMRFAGERSVEAALERLDASRDPRLTELMRELKDLYASARAGSMTREEALGRIGEIDAKLRETVAERTNSAGARTWREAAMKSLAEKGRELAKDPATAALGRALADGDLDAATKESRSLAGDAKSGASKLKLTPEQSKALAELMKSAAKAGGRELDVLSRDLENAARALTVEDMKRLAESFEAAAGECDRIKDEMGKMKDLARAAEELEEMKQALGSLERGPSGQWEMRLAKSGALAGGFFQMTGADAPDKEKGSPGVGSEKLGPGTGGKPEHIDATRTPAEVTGRWGEGATLVEVVKGASSEGLATLAYRKAAESAAREAESAVHGEDIPLGYRLYVKRYFQMIQPRPDGPDN